MANSARIDELRKKFDENPRRYFAPLANEYRKAGDLEQAIFICQEYLPQQPGHMSGHIVHGQALYDVGRTDDAKAAFETALSLDPENLIALRYLGDIARQSGDTDAARMWYQRVLEADPRNEEIAQLMISLLSAPHPSSVSSSAPTPIASAAPVPPPDSWRSAVPDTATADDAALAFDIEKSEAADTPTITDDAPVAPAAPTPVSSAAVEPTTDDSFRRKYNEDELLDFDDASIGGLPISGIASNVQIETPPEGAGATLDTTADATADVPGFESTNVDEESRTFGATEPADGREPAFGMDASFEADPFAIATPTSDADSFEETGLASALLDPAPSAEPEIELAADITLGLPDDGLAMTEAGPTDNPPLDGLETFEPGFVGAAPGDAALGTESYFADDESDSATDIAIEASTDAGELSAPETDEVSAEPMMSSAAEQAEDTEHVEEDVPVVPPLPQLQTPVWSSNPVDTSAAASDAFGTTPAFRDAVSASDEALWGDPAPESAPIDGGHDGRDVPDVETIAPEDASAGEPAEAFMTETMAELYLQQGHLESALGIYRRLVSQRPDDVELASRLRDVEAQIYGPAPEESEPHATGPTIREYLLSVFAGAGHASQVEPAQQALADELPESDPDRHDVAASRNGDRAGAMTLAEEATFEHPEQAEAAGLGQPETFETVAQPEPPVARHEPTPSMSQETVRGSIDALFSGASASNADTSAAATLAEAFGEQSPPEPSPAPLSGVPAHRAPDELSLDHVFKGNAPPRPSAELDGFSFDQFFAANVDDAGSAPSTPSAAEPEEGDDIAQFNAWLNGLKKT